MLVHDKHEKLRDNSQESVSKQIVTVVPYDLRKNILYLAHELPCEGHLETKKILKRICKYLHLLKVNRDVKKYCKSCDMFQRMIKS